MSDEVSQAQRPLSISIICVLGFIGAVFTIPLIFSDIVRQIGPWYPPFLALSAVVGLACMIGLWMMKKWAAYTYTVFAVICQIVLLVMGAWNVMSLVIPAIIVILALKNLSKMT